MMMVVSLSMLLLLLTGTLAKEDLSGKVFLFPKPTTAAHVLLKPEVPTLLQQVSICLQSYTDLSRAHALFSLATPTGDNTFLIFPRPPNVCSVYINQEQHDITMDPLTLDWRHTCITWDSTSGVTQLWVNGKLYPRRVVGKGSTIGPDTSIVLGQDQDSYGGEFDAQQSFVGEISDVHMWDHVLTPEEIRKVMYGDHQGNLINWNSLSYEIKGGALVQPKLQCKPWGASGSSYTPCSF